MSQSVMTERTRVEEAVTRFFQMCNSHCPGNVAPLLTADAEVLDARAARGPEGVHSYLVWLWQTCPDLTFRVEHILVDGHMAAAEVLVEAQGECRRRCVLFQFRDGLIRRMRWY